ncbi:MAG: hypothetical protein KF812_04120 [Fimbriimonadaceae bacterium]|nr:hypothetical protein [Fimbriimonadaceae bacterium]
MKYALLLPALFLAIACQPQPKGLFGTYRIRITPDLEKEFQEADKLVADAWKTDKDRAEQMAMNHPRRIVQSQRLEIKSDGTYRYVGSYDGEDAVLEGEAKLVDNVLTLTPKMRNGNATAELGLIPQQYRYDPDSETLTIEVDDAPLIWEK